MHIEIQGNTDYFSSSCTTNNASSTISDLSTVTQRQASMESSHMDTSESLPNQFNMYVGQTNDLSPPGPPTGVYSLAAIGGESKYIFF